MRGSLRSVLVIPFVALAISQFAYSQSNPPQRQPSTEQTHSSDDEDSGRIGVSVKASTLGGGGEVAVRVTHRTNLRAGFNVISYSRGFDKDGIAYHGQLDFKTFEAHYDIFPWAKSFHISGGVLVYATDPITATALVPANQSFTLGEVTYFSDSTNPVSGSGKIVFNRVAPTITIGWGNLVPRSRSKHFSMPFEVGVAFQGSPKATLELGGSLCETPGTNCRSVASDAAVHSQIVSEQNKVNDSMSFFKVYPIISVGFGYKF